MICYDRDDTKKLWNFIFIVVPFCPLNNCARHFYQWSIVTGPYENTWWQRDFFQGEATHCWSDLVITENFINSAAQFLLEEACGSARFLFRFQDD